MLLFVVIGGGGVFCQYEYKKCLVVDQKDSLTARQKIEIKNP